MSTLTREHQRILDGEGGRPSPIGWGAKDMLLGTLLYSLDQRFTVDDIVNPTVGNLRIGTISEEVAAAGVTIDGLKVKDAGIDASGLATGVGYLGLADNLASAWVIKQGANAYLTFVTTDGSESIASAKRLTTTDGVASGTARVVGGVASAMVAEPATLSALAAPADFATTHSIPANTFKVGTVVRARIVIRHPATNATDTFQYAVSLGATALHTTAAVDLANGDATVILLEIVSREAPGATAELMANGSSVNKATAAASCVVADFDTTGALVLKVTATHSVNNAGNQSILAGFTIEYIG